MKRIKHYDSYELKKGVYSLLPENYKGYKIVFRKNDGPNQKYTTARIKVGNKNIHSTWGIDKPQAFARAKQIIDKII